MSVHVKSRLYLFRNPFFVSKRARCLLAGTYCVETYEQVVTGENFLTYQPVLTLLHLKTTTGSGSSDGMIEVNPEELELAVMMDPDKAVCWDFLEDDMSEQEQQLIAGIYRTKRHASERSPFMALVH